MLKFKFKKAAEKVVEYLDADQYIAVGDLVDNEYYAPLYVLRAEKASFLKRLKGTKYELTRLELKVTDLTISNLNVDDVKEIDLMKKLRIANIRTIKGNVLANIPGVNLNVQGGEEMSASIELYDLKKKKMEFAQLNGKLKNAKFDTKNLLFPCKDRLVVVTESVCVTGQGAMRERRMLHVNAALGGGAVIPAAPASVSANIHLNADEVASGEIQSGTILACKCKEIAIEEDGTIRGLVDLGGRARLAAASHDLELIEEIKMELNPFIQSEMLKQKFKSLLSQVSSDMEFQVLKIYLRYFEQVKDSDAFIKEHQTLFQNQLGLKDLQSLNNAFTSISANVHDFMDFLKDKDSLREPCIGLLDAVLDLGIDVAKKLALLAQTSQEQPLLNIVQDLMQQKEVELKDRDIQLIMDFGEVLIHRGVEFLNENKKLRVIEDPTDLLDLYVVAYALLENNESRPSVANVSL